MLSKAIIYRFSHLFLNIVDKKCIYNYSFIEQSYKVLHGYNVNHLITKKEFILDYKLQLLKNSYLFKEILDLRYKLSILSDNCLEEKSKEKLAIMVSTFGMKHCMNSHVFSVSVSLIILC